MGLVAIESEVTMAVRATPAYVDALHKVKSGKKEHYLKNDSGYIFDNVMIIQFLKLILSDKQLFPKGYRN